MAETKRRPLQTAAAEALVVGAAGPGPGCFALGYGVGLRGLSVGGRGGAC